MVICSFGYETDVKNPRVRSEADNLFGCYGTLVSTYKGVWRSHARGGWVMRGLGYILFVSMCFIKAYRKRPSEINGSDGLACMDCFTPTNACVPWGTHPTPEISKG